MDEHFIYIVLEIVSEIPKGNVDLKACQWKI